MLQSKTRFALQSEHSAAHFGALLKIVRHRQGVRQLQVLAHLPGWTQATYSRVKTGEIAPAFDHLAQIYTALRLAGVELNAADRQHFLTLARLRIEAKKTYQEHRTDAEWDELRLRLSRTDRDTATNGQTAPRQRAVSTSPRLVETRHLVGREDWLASVMASLQETLPKKLIVLQGPVGIGKSSELHRLALQMLSIEPSHFQVALCELPSAEQETDPESALDVLLGTLIAEMGTSDASMQMTLLDTRVTYALHCLEKASRPMLVFVDNAEHLLDDEGKFAPCWERFLQRFLRSQHRASLVLATREWPGWFEGERTFLAERLIPSLSREAGALLLQQLGLADVPTEYLRQASEAVGGIPLCLEWVASLVQEPMWLDEWQESDDLEEQEGESADENVSTRRLLRLLNDASLFGGPISTKLNPLLERIVEKRLSAEAYQVLCTLACANVPLGKTALQMVCPHPRLLKELSATSLLVAHPQRVQVLPMVASAVRARLSTAQQLQIEERLIEVYRRWLDAGKASNQEMGAIIAEMAILSLKHHRLLDAAQLLIRHGWLSFNLGLAPRLARFAQDIMQHFDWHSTGENECGGLLLHYFLSPYLGKSMDAAQRFEEYQSIQAAVLAGNVVLLPLTEVHVLHHLILYALNTLRFEDAQAFLEASCGRLESPHMSSRDLKISFLEERALLFGRWCEYVEEQGEMLRAEVYREQTIALYRQCYALLEAGVNDEETPLQKSAVKKRLALCLNNLCYQLNRIGQYEEALEVIERCIALKEQGYTQFGALASAYGEKSQVLMALGRFQEALLFDEKALADVQHLARLGHRSSQEEVWMYQVNRARLYLRLGRRDEAEHLLREALPNIHPRRRVYRMFAENALEEIERWRRQATSPSRQLDWRWIKRYRDLDAYDAFWWWAQAGPFNQEEQQQWDQLYRPALDEATKEQLGGLIAQSRQRELVAAIAEQREPHLYYPALDIEEVRVRIAGLLQLDSEVSQQEPNVIVRRLYHGAIEDEVCFLRLIEATYEGESERFWELSRRLNPVPTPEEMQYALAGVRSVLLRGLLRPELVDVCQCLIRVLDEQFHLSFDLSSGNEEAQVSPKADAQTSARPQQKVTAQAARRFFEAVLRESGYEGWQVVIDPKTSGPRVEAGLRQLFLPDTPLSLERLRHYLSHELAGHVARAVNGENSLLGLLGINTRGYMPTEEGLALYQERQVAALYGQEFDDSVLWMGALATGLASGVVAPAQTFRSLFTFFEAFHLLARLVERYDDDMPTAQEKARKAALATCLRTYRGVPDLTQAGVCYTKDIVYLRGIRLIEDAMAKDETVLDQLAVGKVAVAYLPDLRELGIVASSQPLRELAYDPNVETRILSFEISQDLSAKDA
jgi:tetratricopeptide (TPR) repeat protein/transcriptional regulator with XRE-family HTH domain